MRRTIDRSSVLPFYYQLKEILVSEIEARGMQPGDRLPGDHDLCVTYDVSRTVARQALSELESEGLIERVKGRGTFVAQPRTAQGLAQSLTGLYEDVAAHGGILYSKVRRLEVVPADAHVARELKIEPGEDVVAIERLRFVNNEPWVLASTYLPGDLAPGIVAEDLSNQSLYALLENKYGVKLARGVRSIEATTAGSSLSRDLGIASGAAVLVLRSISSDPDNRPVETFVAYHRADRSRFVVELTRKPPRSPGTSAPLVVVKLPAPQAQPLGKAVALLSGQDYIIVRMVSR
jgi:GntR family transcriptional regulator